jgi:hypothetical protein
MIEVQSDIHHFYGLTYIKHKMNRAKEIFFRFMDPTAAASILNGDGGRRRARTPAGSERFTRRCHQAIGPGHFSFEKTQDSINQLCKCASKEQSHSQIVIF